MFLGGQRDIKKWACVWSRVVQICGVLPYFPTNDSRRRKGTRVPEKDLQNMDREKINWQHILLNHDDQLFASFPVVKQEHVERITGCIGFFHLFPICDVRNCELLNSMMTQICSRNRSHRVVKQRMSSYELNPPKEKGVNLEGLGRWNSVTHIYTHIHIRIFTNTYTCTYMYTHTHKCAGIRKMKLYSTYIYTYTYTYIHKYIHVYIYVYTLIGAQVFETNIYICTCMYLWIYVYVYVYIYVYTHS